LKAMGYNSAKEFNTKLLEMISSKNKRIKPSGKAVLQSTGEK
jgi:hypothetical protein